jgi:hypothetical protein
MFYQGLQINLVIEISVRDTTLFVASRRPHLLFSIGSADTYFGWLQLKQELVLDVNWID